MEGLRHRKPGGGAGVCAESVEFSGLRLLVSPVQDALTPKNVGQDEIHKDPTPRTSPQHAFSRSSPPCAVAFTGSYLSPNNAVNSVLWKRVYRTEFRSGPASRKHWVNRTLQAGRATTLGGCRERRDERGGFGEPSRVHPRETIRTRGEIGMEHSPLPVPLGAGQNAQRRGGAGLIPVPGGPRCD